MTEKDFQNQIEALKRIKMTEGEKSTMLQRILATPIKSPYWKKNKVLFFAYLNRTQAVVALCLIFILTFSGTVYASSSALPGELLYPVKVKIVEPVLDVVNSSPEKKIAWQEEKVVRRIEEAHALADQDKLDDKKLEELERRIEKNSEEFVKVAEREEKEEDLKEAFREKLKKEREEKTEEKEKIERKERGDEKEISEEEKNERSKKEGENKEKIDKLRDSALKVLDKREKEGKKDREEQEDVRRSGGKKK